MRPWLSELCGSLSTSRTRRPARASAPPKRCEIDVLPTPPFMLIALITSMSPSGSLLIGRAIPRESEALAERALRVVGPPWLMCVDRWGPGHPAVPTGTRVIDSQPEAFARATPDTQQGSQEFVCHCLDIVGPQEDRHVLRQVDLVDPAEHPQVIPQPRPDPLHRVVMDLPDAVAVVVPRPLAGRMADRRVPAADLRQAARGGPFIRVGHHQRPGHLPDELPERIPIRVLHDPQPQQSGVAPDHPGDWGAVIGGGAVPRPLVASATWRVVGVEVREAFFPPRSGTSRRPRPPCRPAAAGRRPSAPAPGTGA